jgi:peptidoglycan/LPS O-acetylase OafA/YrhL
MTVVADTTIGARVRAGMPALTSLRFFAALSVLFFHFGAGAAEEFGAPKPLISILKNGYLGVTFFFILSGFILTCAYDGRLKTARHWQEYAASRFARVYPVYLLGLILILPFYLATRPDPAWQALFLVQSWTLPASHLGTSWNMPAWTLSIELFFYLLFPFLMLVLAKLPRWTPAAGALIFAALIAGFNLSAIAPGATPGGVLELIPTPLIRLPEFCLGITLAQLLFAFNARPLPAWSSPAMLICALLIVALMATGWHVPGLISIGFAGLILFASISKGVIHDVLSAKFLVLLGGASYALYLLQMGVHEAVTAAFAGRHETLGRIVFPFVIVTVALAVFVYFEEPARRYVKRQLTRPATPTARAESKADAR